MTAVKDVPDQGRYKKESMNNEREATMILLPLSLKLINKLFKSKIKVPLLRSKCPIWTINLLTLLTDHPLLCPQGTLPDHLCWALCCLSVSLSSQVAGAETEAHRGQDYYLRR